MTNLVWAEVFLKLEFRPQKPDKCTCARANLHKMIKLKMFLKYVLRNIYACLTAIMNGSQIPTALDRNPLCMHWKKRNSKFSLCFSFS